MGCYTHVLKLLPAHVFLGICDTNLQIGWPGAILPIWCSQRLKDIWLDVKVGERKCISVSLVCFLFPLLALLRVSAGLSLWASFSHPQPGRLPLLLCQNPQGCRDNRKPVPDEVASRLRRNHSLNVKESSLGFCFVLKEIFKSPGSTFTLSLCHLVLAQSCLHIENPYISL